MKRNLFFLAAGALALTACTSEDVLEDAVKSQNAITFENVVNKHSRADITSGNISKFNVFGFYTTPENPEVAVEVFDNVAVNRDENTQRWVAEETRYWVPDAIYYFYAYSCGGSDDFDGKLNKEYGTFSLDTITYENGKEASERVLEIKNYRCDSKHQHDLIYASNVTGIKGKATGNETVPLQFRHILSKVAAQFTSAFPADYTLRVSNVTVQNIFNVGDYNPQNGWTGQKISVNDNFPLVSLLNTNTSIDTKNGAAPAVTQTAYVLPYAYNAEGVTRKISLSFTIDVFNKTELIYHQNMTGTFQPKWEAGTSYTYNISISGAEAKLEVIEFTTTIRDEEGNELDSVVEWETPDKIDINVDK